MLHRLPSLEALSGVETVSLRRRRRGRRKKEREGSSWNLRGVRTKNHQLAYARIPKTKRNPLSFYSSPFLSSFPFLLSSCARALKMFSLFFPPLRRVSPPFSQYGKNLVTPMFTILWLRYAYVKYVMAMLRLCSICHAYVTPVFNMSCLQIAYFNYVRSQFLTNISVFVHNSLLT